MHPNVKHFENATGQMRPSTDSASQPTPAQAKTATQLHGTVDVPGDKSISHRALMLASQALGTTTIHGLLEGEDVLRTATALKACGVPIARQADGVWVVHGLGIGGLHCPDTTLDMGNAGTAVRLMMGLLAPYPFHVTFTGDDSLKKRPMQRVMTPLIQMGAQFEASEGGRLPLTLKGNNHSLPVHYRLPVASAQVKSAILLAALNTKGTTVVVEPEATRDHTERMLKFFGIALQSTTSELGTTIRINGQQQQKPQNRSISVPADPSSAAFPIVAALLVPHAQVTIRNVCLNPLRTGLIDTLKEMGADIRIENPRELGGEPVGDIVVRQSRLKPVDVPAHRAPSMIDEYPILAVAAACAQGTSRMRGLTELKVKESDRLAAIITGLQACGVSARAEGDDLIIEGKGGIPGGGTVTTHYDHRIAMSFLVAGMVSGQPITVDDTRAIATSFPGFMPLMEGLGAAFVMPNAPRTPLVIAVDGPAASGKGTLARRLADHFGLAYLDTGSLYRAVGMKLLYADKDPTDVAAAIAAARTIKEHDLANPKLRGERVGQAASIVSAIPEVREALLDYQRQFAAKPEGAVLDGRDIGTVVCPTANVKLFITADIRTRAERRHRQLEDYGITVDYQSVEEDLKERDARDAARPVAPLRAAADAIILDTTGLSANEVFERTLALFQSHRS